MPHWRGWSSRVTGLPNATQSHHEDLTSSRPPAWFPGWGDTDVRDFLDGPRARLSELRRACRIFIEFIRGFRALHFVGPCVTVFGSARLPETDPSYQQARELAARISRLGVTIMTGGGPGIMEAANRGAKDAGGRSIGCNIKLPMEQKPNPYVDTFIEFRYFFVRKVMLVKYSAAFVVMPGGFGTMDELFEALTLVQTGKIASFPVVLVGTEFWSPMIHFIRETLARRGLIDRADLNLLTVTDDPSEAVAAVMRGVAVHRAASPIKRSRLLGERT
ncbi:MAG: TIGR00730 family Rossman fold protein [Phycisphaerae bacterium]|nr:TIGR00730 family Rossman fold protein [Phycisphaerae bacterium]